MQELASNILIDAPRERVWRILLDFDRYPEWNPFVSRITGWPAVGEQLDIRLTPPGGMALSFKPEVVRVEPEREFRWLGKLLIKGMFDGEHIFELEEESPETVRFVQREAFSGLLVPLLLLLARKSTLRGFEAMNQALKQRAESTTD